MWTNLIKDGEFRFETSADKVHNFIIAFWFLLSKLVTWECQNLQAYVSSTTQSFVLIKFIYKARETKIIRATYHRNIAQNRVPP